MKVCLIVQARMASERLPGKVLMRILDKPLLGYVLERVQRASTVDQVIVAAPEGGFDEPIADFCRQAGVACERGPEADVLERYWLAANKHGADAVVRVTADCPLIDPAVVDLVVRRFLDSNGSYDYVSNVIQRTFPRGMDCEALTFSLLDRLRSEVTRPVDREHVTSHVYTHPERFRLANVAYRADASDHRWTVDTEQDFSLIQNILGTLYPANPRFDLEDVLTLVRRYPDWRKLNSSVRQKSHEE